MVASGYFVKRVDEPLGMWMSLSVDESFRGSCFLAGSFVLGGVVIIFFVAGLNKKIPLPAKRRTSHDAGSGIKFRHKKPGVRCYPYPRICVSLPLGR